MVAITGAGGEQGKATASALAERGASVALGDLHYARAERVASAINHTITLDGGGLAVALGLDVRDRGAFRRFLDEVRSDLGPVDVVVNHVLAGVSTSLELAACAMAPGGHVVAVGVGAESERMTEVARPAAAGGIAFTGVIARAEPPVAPDRIAAGVVNGIRTRPGVVRVPRHGHVLRRRLNSALPAGRRGH